MFLSLTEHNSWEMLIQRADNNGERQLQLSTLVSTKRNEPLTQAMTLTNYFVYFTSWLSFDDNKWHIENEILIQISEFSEIEIRRKRGSLTGITLAFFGHT